MTSDVALGLLLVVAGIVAVVDSTMPFPGTIGGLLLALVGLDPITGVLRLTWGVEALTEGISVYLVLLGLIIVADGMVCLYSPWLFVDTCVRLIAGWRALEMPRPVAVAIRIVAALAMAGACVAAFYLNASAWDVGGVFLFGLFGVACKLLVWNRLVLLLAASLGPVLEQSVRQTMVLSGGDPEIFLQWPISAVALALAAIILGLAAATTRMQRR